MLKNCYLLLISVVVLNSCASFGTSEFKIDNPTNSVVKVEVDGQLMEVAPETFSPVKLSDGEHTIKLVEGTAADGKTVVVYVYPENSGGIINPTLSGYVAFTELYTPEDPNVKDNAAIGRGAKVINGKLYYGSMVLRNDFAMGRGIASKAWNYDIDEDFPETIEVEMNMGQTIKTKMFRVKDFERYYEFFYETPEAVVDSYYSTFPAAELKAVNKLDSIDLSGFDSDPSIKEKVIAYLDNQKKRSESLSKSERRKLHVESVDLLSPIVSVAASGHAPKEMQEAYQSLIDNTSYAEEAGLRIKEVR